MTVLVPNGLGAEVFIDECDSERVLAMPWQVYFAEGTYHCIHMSKRNGTWLRIKLHRFILSAEADDIVDHINGDRLDNRRSNLRFVTPSENVMNRRKSAGCASVFKGVAKNPSVRSPWRAYIGAPQRHLGCFASEEAAAHAYDDAARQMFGKFAAVNFPKAGEQGALRHALNHQARFNSEVSDVR